MTWFKIDDGFWSHPKVAMLSDGAVALWARAGSYSCQHLTDGAVARTLLRMLGTVEAADELVAAGLWDATPDGWVFHDWSEYQETSEVVKKRRDAWRSRQRRSRESREQKRNDSHGDSRGESHDVSHVTEGVTPGVSPRVPSRPVPSRPGHSASALRDAREAAFADGTPIPPEPDDDRAELVLVTDDAPVVEIASRAPKVHVGSSVQTLVRQHVPAGIPKDVQRKVAEQAQRLANDPNVDRRDLEAALVEWARRSDAGPGLLPHLVADAARARQGGKAGASRPEHKTRTLARLIAEADSNDQKGIS